MLAIVSAILAWVCCAGVLAALLDGDSRPFWRCPRCGVSMPCPEGEEQYAGESAPDVCAVCDLWLELQEPEWTCADKRATPTGEETGGRHEAKGGGQV